MKSNDKLRLVFNGYLRYFRLSIALSLMALVMGSMLIRGLSNRTWDSLWFVVVLIVFLSLLGIAIWLTIWLVRLLNFDVYKGVLTGDQFREAIHFTAEELDWTIVRLSDMEFKGERRGDGFVGGEYITIRRRQGELLVNSTSHPYKKVGWQSVARNKENRMLFVYNIAALLRGEDLFQLMADRQKWKEEAFWRESEWSPKRWFQRILVYTWIAFWVVFGIAIFKEDPISILLPIVGGGGLGGIFIWSDLKMIKMKRAYRKKNQKI